MGTKPTWAKRLIINARSETVSKKETFKEAFATNRCLVPCTGWYEWRDEEGAGKTKYLLTHSSGDIPFFMAGITISDDGINQQLVTLTTRPNKKCVDSSRRYHQMV